MASVMNASWTPERSASMAVATQSLAAVKPSTKAWRRAGRARATSLLSKIDQERFMRRRSFGRGSKPGIGVLRTPFVRVWTCQISMSRRRAQARHAPA